MVSLLERPDEGAVFYDERRVDNLDRDSLIRQRRRIGMIFQNFNLFSSRTAGKNIAYPLELAKMPKDRIKLRERKCLVLLGLRTEKMLR